MALFSFRKKAGIPTAEEALPGRAEPLAVPDRHFVTRRSIKPPFPEGLEQAVFGMGCFWGAERKFWQTEGVHTTAVGYAGGVTPNPTYDEVCSGMTGHAEVVLVVFDPKVVSYDSLLRVFWEAHDPTQGMRQGNDSRHAVPLDHLHVRRRAGRGRGRVARRLPVRARARGLRPGHDRDPARATLLLRRGLPPAVPRQESRRLLRNRRHRRGVSRGSRRRPLAAAQIPVSRAPRGKPRRVMLAGVFCHLRLALDLPRGAVQCGWWSRS